MSGVDEDAAAAAAELLRRAQEDYRLQEGARIQAQHAAAAAAAAENKG